MKKTLFFLLGLLMVSVMPGKELRAQSQSVLVNVTAKTLDRAALSSARIYLAQAGQAYFVDSSYLNPAWVGSAVWIDTLTTYTNLTIMPDGYQVIGMVDSAFYGMSFIVMTDVEGRNYVIGSQNDSGAFYPVAMFAGLSSLNFNVEMTAHDNLLDNDPQKIVDDEGYRYSSLASAAANSVADAVLTFIDTVRVDAPVVFNHNVNIYQAGLPLISTYASVDTALVTVSGATVSWFGFNPTADVSMPAAPCNIFESDNAVFNLRQFTANISGSTVVARNASAVTMAKCTLASGLTAPAVKLCDASNATISTVTVNGANFALFDSTATGTLTILDSVVRNSTAFIDGDAYYKDGNYRKYNRTLTLAAAGAFDTVFVTRNLAAGMSDTIAHRLVVDLGGDSVMGALYLAHNADTVWMQNGVVNLMEGVGASAGTLVVNNLDSVGNLVANNLIVRILDGRFTNVQPTSGADVTIYGGKFAQNRDIIINYVALRHTLDDNTDADAASFPYKVINGYFVTFVNFNGRGDDSVALINTPDARIVPAPPTPTYVGSGVDTIFSAYWMDSNYTTPWNFLYDTLSGDMKLYAQWYYFDPTIDARYTVYHQLQDMTDPTLYVLRDSTFCVAGAGDSIGIYPNTYVGYVARPSLIVVDPLVDGFDTTFFYDRKGYTITYVIGNGSVIIDTILYGDTVIYPTVTRPGYTFAGWSSIITRMPHNDVVVDAIFTPNSYPLTWVGADTTVVYTGVAATAVMATFVDDNNVNVPATLTYTDLLGNEVQPVNVGYYYVNASYVDTNYHLAGTLQATLTIRPATVSATGIEVVTAKLYDGNDTVEVTNAGELSWKYNTDDVYLVTTANFVGINAGENKTIIAHPKLRGADAYNYVLADSNIVIVTTGVIVEPMSFNGSFGGGIGGDGLNNDNGISATAEGYCSGEATVINYSLTTGNPDQFRLAYSAQAIAAGFVDVPWGAITTPGIVPVTVPANCPTGDYRVWLSLSKTVNGVTFYSDTIAVGFHVNLSKEYIKPIFNDVISIVDTCQCIDQNSVTWYHKGATETTWTNVGTGAYYRDPSGSLNGEYYATLTINGAQTRTCVQADVATLITDEPDVTVKVYPNPTADNVTVRVENASAFTHTYTVMNILGMTVANGTFDGDVTTIDLSSFANGSYTVSVDGIVVRVIKK